MNQFGAGPSQPASSDALFPGFPTLDLGRLFHVVRKRLWLAGLVAAAFVGLAVLYLMVTPSVYQSSAVIYVEPKNEGAVFSGIKGVKQASWETLDALKSMAEGIRNGAVILRVVERLDLRNDPGFLKPREGGYTDAEIVEMVSKRVDAELRRGTRLIDVSVKDHSPERAQKMTAGFIEEFQSLIREQNVDSSRGSRAMLEKEAEAQLVRLNAAEEKLQEFRLRNSEVALDDTKDYVATKLSDLDRMLSEAENQTLQRKAEYEQYQQIPKEDIERVFEIGGHGSQDHIQKLLLARNLKRAEFAKIKSQYQPGHQTYNDYLLDLEGQEEQVRIVAQTVGDSIEKFAFTMSRRRREGALPDGSGRVSTPESSFLDSVRSHWIQLCGLSAAAAAARPRAETESRLFRRGRRVS